MRFSTSSGCLKSGAFFSVYLGGWVWECEAFNVHIKPRSHTCLIVVSPFPLRPLVSFYSLRCGVHPHGTRPFTSSVNACLLSSCETIFKLFFFDYGRCERLQHIKPKLTEKEEKKTTSCRYFFLLWMFAFCFSLPLRTVTSFVFHSSHTHFSALPVCCFVFMQ